MKLNEKYNTVLIIGNGFDLGFDLPTSYSDFVASKEFNELVRKGNKLSRHLRDTHSLQNWIDIENELKIYSKKLPKNDTSLLPEFKELSQKLQDYISTIQYDDLYTGSMIYEILMDITNDDVLILDFNYTKTLNKIFWDKGIETNATGSNIHHIKIHGSVEFRNIIFGIEDGIDINPNHIFLKKSTNPNYNAKDFSSIIENSNNVYIIGHSLGETDHMYFEKFFTSAARKSNAKKQQSISIFHYGEESYNKLFAQLDRLTFKHITRLRQFNNFEMIDTKK